MPVLRMKKGTTILWHYGTDIVPWKDILSDPVMNALTTLVLMHYDPAEVMTCEDLGRGRTIWSQTFPSENVMDIFLAIQRAHTAYVSTYGVRHDSPDQRVAVDGPDHDPDPDSGPPPDSSGLDRE